jgi:threonine/homoserine/homoserine lactone efflux protein
MLRGFLSNVFNPKSVLFFVSVVPTFVGTSPGHPNFPFQMAILGIVYVAIATAVHASIVLLAAELRPWLVEGPRQNMVRRVLAVARVMRREKPEKRFGEDRHDPYGPDEKVTHDVIDPTSRPRS